MKIESELTNIFKKLSTLEAQLERTLRQLESGDYGEGWKGDLFDDVIYAKDKIIEAREAIEGRIPPKTKASNLNRLRLPRHE